MNKILKIYQNVENSLSYLLSNNCDEKKFLKEKFKKKKIIFLDLGSNLGTYTDLINKNEVKRIIKDFSKNTKSEVITLSTLEKNSIVKIKSKLISYVS